jgi:mycothiol synthase
VSVRVPEVAEAESLAALLNAHSAALHGTADLAEATMRSWFEIPESEMLVVDGAAGLEAYADFVPDAGSDRAWIDLRAHPQHPAAAEPLLEAFELRAHEVGKARVRTQISSRDDVLRAVLEQRGYRPIRHSFRMLVELDEEPPEPWFPDGLDVRVMRAGEEPAVHAAQMAAFADHWGFHPDPYENWRGWNLDRPGSRPDLWWLALDRDAITAICLNRMADSGEPDHGYVHILGVLPQWRRRGLGEALLRHSFREFHKRGCRRVSLDVDGENTTGAVRLYERVGMHVERRSDIYEKRLDV